MSDNLLNALMQLFAITASAESKLADRHAIINSFLGNELNKNAINEHINLFEKYFSDYHHPQTNLRKKRKRTAASSVKILRICSEIKESLSQKQIYIVLIRLFEFIKLGSENYSEGLEFVKTVAESFEIDNGTYNQIKSFTQEKNALALDFKQILIISGANNLKQKKFKHKLIDNFMGNLAILNLESADLFVIRYFGIHELYLNNQTIRRGKIYVLNIDSILKDHSHNILYFNEIHNSFYKEVEKEELHFEAQNLYLRFKDGNVGLHNISFNECSGQLIGIMGTSGTGKTTLLNVLNGTNKPIHGKVLLNGIDIHANKQKLNGLIGHVSQDDYLIEELTVFQNLYFNAKLNFSGHNDTFIKSKTDETLQLLGLLNIKDSKVGNTLDKRISGGQRKRLNIALELIREPSILFLDEPTSGLSSKDSEIIMDLLKNLASRGKLIFNVIHQPSSDIFKMFDKLYVIDQGGYLIYNGSPVNAINYFKNQIHLDEFDHDVCNTCGNVKPEQIFNIIESNVIDEYGNETRIRKISPSEWFEKYKDNIEPKLNTQENYSKKLPKNSFKIPDWIHQFSVFFKRDILAKISNIQYIIVNLLEAPILAFMLSYIIKYYDIDTKAGYVLGKNSNFPIYLFIAVIIALFIGLTVSAQEIIKDKRILKRERFLHLSRSSYLFSKISILFIFSAVQSFLFVLIGNSIMEIESMLLPYWLVLFSTWLFGNMLGLLISDSFKTTVTIYITIPFLIIPQLILSGVMVQFDKINPQISHPGNIPWYGEIITSRWAYEALAVYQFKNNEYEKNLFHYDKMISKAAFKENYWVSELKTRVVKTRNLLSKKQTLELIKYLKLIKTEVLKENKNNLKLQFNYLNKLDISNYDSETSFKLEDYLNELKTFYNKTYNKLDYLRNKRIKELQKAAGGKINFVNWKLTHYNKGLERFVRNTSENNKIIEFEDQLYQKTDPIYKDPESGFFKAHFYSSRKKIFNQYIDTFWANLSMIWIMTLLTYFMLYYQLLSRIINLFYRKEKKNSNYEIS